MNVYYYNVIFISIHCSDLHLYPWEIFEMQKIPIVLEKSLNTPSGLWRHFCTKNDLPLVHNNNSSIVTRSKLILESFIFNIHKEKRAVICNYRHPH